MKTLFILFAACGLMMGASLPNKEVSKRLDAAEDVLKTALDAGDQSIPRELIEKSHCIGIVPSLKQGGFIVGAKYGKGYLFCRKAGGGWQGPGTIRIEGGSFGLQIGGGESDVIMLVMNAAGADRLLRNEFKLGGNAGVMAGPVGRTASAETDAYMRAEILAYSRSRGLFAGLTLSGSTMREDSKDNAELYGKAVSNQTILEGKAMRTPARAIELRNMLNKVSAWEKK
jgi:SH3 domain-containing YSC84-like protein 1